LRRLKCLGLVLAFALALAMLLPHAHALDATIALEGDRAHVHVEVRAELVGVPGLECMIFKGISDRMKIPVVKHGVEDLVEQALERALAARGLDANVENVSISVDYGEGAVSHFVLPSSMSVLNGTLVSGALEDLGSVNGHSVRVRAYNDSNTMRLFIAFNFTVQGFEDRILNVSIKVYGNLSKAVNVKAAVEAFNFTSGAFQALNSTALNSTKPSGALCWLSRPEDYIEDGKLIIAINVTDAQGHPSEEVLLDLDMIKISYIYYTAIVEVVIDFDVEGISNTTIAARSYDLRFRCVKVDEDLSYGEFRFNPCRSFFMDLSAFSAPLEEWERRFNGTHTIFTYRVDSIKVYTPSGFLISIDPQMSIVTEGYAQASGDTITTAELTTETWILIASIIAAIVIIAAITAAKRAKHVIEDIAESRRKFVKRKDKRK